MIGTEFVPEEDRGEFQCWSTCRRARRSTRAWRRSPTVERRSARTPEVRQVFSTVGLQGEVRSSKLQVKLTQKDEREREHPGDQGRGARAAARDAVRRDRRSPIRRVHAGRAVPAADQRLRPRRRHGGAAAHQRRAGDEDPKQVPGAVDVDELARDRPAGDGGARQPRAGRRPRLRRRQRRRCSCAAWSRASCRRSCATATASTTSACGSRRSSATTSRRSRGRRSTRPSGAVVRTADIVGDGAGASARAASTREQRRRQAKIGIDLAGRAARRRHGRRRRRSTATREDAAELRVRASPATSS